jgi:hypothetical protein
MHSACACTLALALTHIHTLVYIHERAYLFVARECVLGAHTHAGARALSLTETPSRARSQVSHTFPLHAIGLHKRHELEAKETQ